MIPKLSGWWPKFKYDPARAWSFRALVVIVVGIVVANTFPYLGKDYDALGLLADLIATGGVAICFGTATWNAYQDRLNRRRKMYLWGSALGTLIALGAAVFFGYRLLHHIF